MVISSAIDQPRIRSQKSKASSGAILSPGFRRTLQKEIAQQRIDSLEERNIRNFLEMKKDGMRGRYHHYWHLYF